MEKTIRLDLEDEAADTVAPPGFGNATPMFVVRRRRAEHRERSKTVIACYLGSGCVEGTTIERSLKRQLVAATKRRVCRVVGPDVVAVPTTHRAVTRMKLGPHLVGTFNPDVRRKHGVHGTPQV